MSVRDRVAVALVSLTVGLLPLVGALAQLGGTRRVADVVVLWVAGALQLGFVLTWTLVPRLPRWIVGGWGLILIAVGIGLAISAPVAESPADGSTLVVALPVLFVVGVVTIVAAAVHETGSATR